MFSFAPSRLLLFSILTTMLIGMAGHFRPGFGPAPYVGGPIIGGSLPVQPTSTCAVTVAPPQLSAGSAEDDTASFQQAMATAVATAPACFRIGPGGAPQAVVYVPAATYRISDLGFVSNVRLEVNADAVLQPTANRASSPTAQRMPMIEWDARSDGAPLTNVSLVGVGSANSGLKWDAARQLGSAMSGFAITNYFTLNLDPRSSGSSNYVTGLAMANVQHFLVQNVLTVENGTLQLKGKDGLTPWPTSARAAILLYSRSDSPVGGPYFDPRDGLIVNQVNLGGPRGYGPNQINSAQDVSLRNIFSQGGTTLRIETDGSATSAGVPLRGSIVDGLSASNIVGYDCNRAVALTPHSQQNGAVSVTQVRAYSCGEAVAEIVDTGLALTRRGGFSSVSVSDIYASSGAQAQLYLDGPQLWGVGPSRAVIRRDAGATWGGSLTAASCSGSFTARSDVAAAPVSQVPSVNC